MYVGCDANVTFFHGQLKSRAKIDPHEELAPRVTLRYVRDMMNEFKNDDDSVVDTDGKTGPDGEAAKAVVLTPSPVTSSVTTGIDIDDCCLMVGHLNARLLKKSARKSGITLNDQLRTCTGFSIAKRIGYPVASMTILRRDHHLRRVGFS